MLFSSILFSQDTFSIVAIDSATGEVGSAGASCISGSIIISDIPDTIKNAPDLTSVKDFFDNFTDSKIEELKNKYKVKEDIDDLFK